MLDLFLIQPRDQLFHRGVWHFSDFIQLLPHDSLAPDLKVELLFIIESDVRFCIFRGLLCDPEQVLGCGVLHWLLGLLIDGFTLTLTRRNHLLWNNYGWQFRPQERFIAAVRWVSRLSLEIASLRLLVHLVYWKHARATTHIRFLTEKQRCDWMQVTQRKPLGSLWPPPSEHCAGAANPARAALNSSTLQSSYSYTSHRPLPF